MSINNGFSLERIKKALNLKTVTIVVLIVAALSAVFYVSVENLEKREVLIWFVTTDAEAGFSDETLKNVNEYGAECGLDRILITRRHPEDRYFDVTMSTSAFYLCDIFIMQKDLALEYADMGMFLSLPDDRLDADSLLYNGEDAVGIPLDDNYYFLINAKTDIDLEIIYDIFYLLGNK